jgi:DNA polymerase I-like protein with 3'-5' exonuclease and polymerase domains
MAESAVSAWRRDQPRDIACDTETEGLAFYDRAFCATFSWRNLQGEIEDHYVEFHEEDYRPIAREILLGSLRWLFHHAKFDLQKLILAEVIGRHEVTAGRIEDTEALAHLDNEHRVKRLKALSAELCGDDNHEEAELKVAMRQHKLKLADGYHLLPRDVLVPYAKADTNKTLRVFEVLEPRVRQHRDLWEMYEFEKDVTLTLLDMESRGLAVDTDYVNTTLNELSREYIRLEGEIALIVGKPIGPDVEAGEFNPGSNPQLKAYFESKGHVSDSYDKHFLAACDDPLATTLVEYRNVAKLKNTYFMALRDEQRDGILHPHFRQHGTRTGRMSSGGVED